MTDTAIALLRALEQTRSAQRAVESVSSDIFPDAHLQDIARDLRWSARKLIHMAEQYGAGTAAIQRVERLGA